MKCLEIGILSDLATDDPPRNVCKLHPLCCNFDCLHFAEPESFFCKDHKLLVCKALTKRRNKCTNRSISRSMPYCRDHIDKYISKVDDNKKNVTSSFTKAAVTVNIFEPVKCNATTTKGKPCKGWAVSGSGYCYDHSAHDNLIAGKAKKIESSDTHGIGLSHDVKIDHTIDEGNKEIMGKSLDTRNANEDNSRDEGNVILCLPCSESDVHQIPDDNEIDKALLTKKVPTDGLDGERSKIEGNLDSLPQQNEKYLNESDPENEEYDPEDEPEYLKHLRDVFEVKDDDCDDESFSSAIGSVDENFEIIPSLNLALSDPNQWHWEMTLDERWNACQALVYRQHRSLVKILELAEKQMLNARRDLRNAKMRARARVYENRSVIGGTMVGEEQWLVVLHA